MKTWQIILIIAAIILLLLYIRWNKCKKENCIPVYCIAAPCPQNNCLPCNFFTGKPNKKSLTKQEQCAKETGFNLQDLDPKAITTTMGINKDKYLECMATAPVPKEGTPCYVFNWTQLLAGAFPGGYEPKLDGIIKNGVCVKS